MSDQIYTPYIDKKVFYTSFFVVAALILLLILFPESTASSTQLIMNILTGKLGWMYLIVSILPLVVCGWLAFGRYGQICLGDASQGPEYSNTSWAAMMFTASMGASLIAWGFAEPIFYLDTPPLNIEKGSHLAVEWAHMYPLYHWSLVPWAMYCLPGVPIAYMLFVRKRSIMRISATCEASLPKQSDALSSMIDIFVVLGVVGGVATSLGFGVPLVASLLVELLGVPDNLLTQLYVILLWTMIFGTSVYYGLKKGIKILADVNLILMVFVMVFILVVGPTVYILSITTNSIGLMMDNIFRMSFWTDPVNKGGFPEAWTIFYWAWWLAYAPMMGLFFCTYIQRSHDQTVYCWGYRYWQCW